MKIVLLSGGSGKRLWPMSNDIRSKQFLRVLPGEKTGMPLQSMLQRVWLQLDRVGLQSNAYVCASKAQAEMIMAQIGDVSIIEEPVRRDTFPAIAMSTLYLLDVERINPSETVVICPVDHFVDDHYFTEIRRLSEHLLASGAQLALMGVEPSEPTSKFGYIVPDNDTRDDVRRVKRFVEKPETKLAEQLIQDGALWNCGVFCFRAETIRNVLEERGWPTTYRDFVRAFETLPKRSFDYEVVEQMESIVVHPYAGTWNDLGTWSALSEQMDSVMVGQGIHHNSEASHIINELGIPVVTMGLKNAIVVATPDGILAADKDISAELKQVIEPLQNRPMYEERLWGTYKVLDYQKLDDGTEVLTKTIELFPGKNLSYQKHVMRSEVWTIIEGEGEVILDSTRFQVSAGDVVRVYADQWHAIRTTNGLKFIEVQRGSELVEEDIVRRYLTWPEIEDALSVGITRTI